MGWDSFLAEKLKVKQYQHKSEAKIDILNALKNYNELYPTEETFVANDGKTSHLLCLCGTIPVQFKGSIYNIPIKIWLLQRYPFVAPLVYVAPTSSMFIKTGKHVDQSGQVYMPFISEWSYPKSSNLSLLIQKMCSIFSAECPVYSKSVPSIGHPPYLGHSQASVNQSYQQGMPVLNMPSPYQPAPYQPVPYPTTQNYPNISGAANGANYTRASTQYPAQNVAQHQLSSGYQATSNITRQGSVIPDEHYRASLLSSAEDKLKMRVKEVFLMGNNELEELESTKTKLQNGNKELKDFMEKMENEQKILKANIHLLKQKNDELDENIVKLENDSYNMNIDEAVVTTTPLYNQILDLFANEIAVVDAIYYLSDALQREVIELDTFLKTVRTLSRTQFILRATLQKARAAASPYSSTPNFNE